MRHDHQARGEHSSDCLNLMIQPHLKAALLVPIRFEFEVNSVDSSISLTLKNGEESRDPCEEMMGQPEVSRVVSTGRRMWYQMGIESHKRCLELPGK